MPDRLYQYQLVDVFSDVPFFGNPLAVVHAAQGMSDADMARLANWFNLSETAFLLPPEDASADYQVRIFTPQRELPFAGHPTLGSCHAWLAAGGQPKGATIVQECGAGLIHIQRDGARLAFAAPPLIKEGPVAEETLEQIALGLGISRDAIKAAQWIDNGPGWIGILMQDSQSVLDLTPDFSALNGLRIGVVGPCLPDDIADFEVRGFTAAGFEDPVTGSLNAGIAQWLMGSGLAAQNYVARQGTVLGRDGRIFVARKDTAIWVGGDCTICVTGQLTL